MQNHVYQFHNEIYKQQEGEPIGLEITGAVARLFMLWWDERWIKTIEQATAGIDWNLLLYLRYVDS